MNEDFGLDVWMEDSLNNGYGYILDLLDNESGEDVEDDDDIDDDVDDGWSDIEADADTLASAGWGMDEDY